MTQRKSSLIVALLALVAVTGACTGKNPNASDPVCMEQGATNIGGPLPCTFPPPAPTVDSVTVKQFAPQPGPETQLKMSIDNWDTGVVIPGDKLNVTTKFSLRQETVDEATADGEEVILIACLSKDGKEPTPDTGNGQCTSTRVVVTPSGETNHSLGVSSDAGITQTSHVWVTFARRPVGSTNYKKVSKYFGGSLVAAQVTWVPQ